MEQIIWTKIASNDMKEIYNYISRDSLKYASITLQKIYNKIQKLKPNPKIGRYVPEYNNKQIREVFEGNYRIIYRIKNKTIEILRIFHSARLLK